MLAQLSLEFLIYLSLAGTGLLLSVYAVSSYRAVMSSAASQYRYSAFLDALARAMYLNASSFTAYVPGQICAAGAADSITPSGSAYYLPETVALDTNAICPSGMKTLNFGMENNTWVLR